MENSLNPSPPTTKEAKIVCQNCNQTLFKITGTDKIPDGVVEGIACRECGWKPSPKATDATIGYKFANKRYMTLHVVNTLTKGNFTEEDLKDYFVDTPLGRMIDLDLLPNSKENE